MKKNNSKGNCLTKKLPINQFLKIMRISIILLFTCVFYSMAESVYTQNAKVTINKRNASMKEVLNEIEAQTDYLFIYNNEVNTDKKVSVRAKSESVADVLNDLLKETDIRYTMEGNHIILFVETEEESAKDEKVLVVQQQRIVTGKVTDQNGEPLPGATVMVKGTTQGTITDADGNYSLSNVPDNATLVFSFVGMETREINVGNRTRIDVTMQEEVVALEEVVAVGYGTMRKSDLTGGISTVIGSNIAKKNTTNISQALQGAASGVMVTRGSGSPGESATIRIRGITTIGNSNPLVIVDGVPGGGVDQVDPNDIESISILKDAASASIYGSRAAAGVILINTKRSKSGELNLNYDFSFGVETPTERPEVVSVIRYMEMNNERTWNDQGNIGNEYPVFPKDEIENYYELNGQNPDRYPITNWEDLIMKKSAPRQKHNLIISGGSNDVKVRGSIAYENIDGLYAHRSFERINSRINSDISVKENLLNVKMDLNFRRNIQNHPMISPGLQGYLAGPVYPAMWSDGRLAGGKNGDNPYGRVEYGGTQNNKNDIIGGKLEVNFMPLSGLNLKALIAPSLRFVYQKDFKKKVPYYDADNPTQLLGYLTGLDRTSLSEVRNQSHDYTLQFLANYEKYFDKYSLNVMAGYEEYSFFTEEMGASRDNFEFTYYPYLSVGPLDYRDNYGNAYENAYRSFFSRILFNWNNKYLFQGNIRYDGSSRFHPDYRWGFFPSLSAGWVLSNESFWRKNSSFSYLKLRGSYGVLGNERIGNYPYQATIAFEPNVLLFQGSNVVSVNSAAQTTWAIPDITWEETKTFNIGLDAYFFDNKLQFTGDLYSKRTSNMLLNLEIPKFLGFNNPDQNAGLMKTKGWDVEISWQDKIGDLSYSVRGNLFDSKSLIKDLKGTEFKGEKITAAGTEYNEWFGYRTDGLFQNQEEINNSAVISAAVKPGDVKFLDISGPEGVPDGIISADYDRVPLGGSLPRFQFGCDFDLRYKNFDFSLVLQGIGKQNVSINKEIWPLRERGWYNAPKEYDGNYWSVYNSEEDNLNAKYPRLSDIAENQNFRTMSDAWLISGAYLRIKNIGLGYSLPQFIAKKIDAQQIRIFLNISDLYSFNNYIKGYDVEVVSSNYPITSTFLFGVNLKF